MSDEEEITLAQHYEHIIRYCLDTYIETQNPIWAWQAVFHWLAPQWHPKPVSLPLPRELIWFLLQTTAGINNLAYGMKPLEYRDGEPVKPSGGFEIKASEACDFLPEALQLRGKKWNAFLEYDKDRLAGYLMNLKLEALAEGASVSEAIERMKDEANTSDERTLRRKLKGGRGPRQKSPYPAPKRLHKISDEKEEIPAKSDPAIAKTGTKPKTRGAKKP
ncbi:MAG: hypothetical protein INF88_13130 [Roseomonas sp.]|nr:hypothetical protein [Roseomonas sp.]